MDFAKRGFLDYCTWDDRLWHLCLVTYRNQWLERRGRHKNSDEGVLFKLLQMGTSDPLSVQGFTDHPGDEAVRGIRFATAMGDRLWSLLEAEQERVSL